jgi:DMSO/TMAO reductase YedYZ molybdopterin-dependent catalytic subunit
MKLPPNQQVAALGKWPVVGEKAPRLDPAPWRVAVTGLSACPRRWSLEELRALPQVEREVDIHCVTRWSKPACRFRGVPLAQILAACPPLPAAAFVSFVARSERRHSTSLPLQEALELGTLVALEYEGEPLAEIHGGPVRTVVPGRYFYKSLKWLERIDLLAEDRLGYWEQEAGYHNRADPWQEERYMAPDLDRRTLRRVLEARDFAGQSLRSLAAVGFELQGLNARGALLRDADFRDANLQGACFSAANLSNAHFQGADLCGADFRGADLEGADFRGADLRAADLRDVSLLGTTFWGDPGAPARLDGATRFDSAALETLAPEQAEFIRRAKEES